MDRAAYGLLGFKPGDPGLQTLTLLEFTRALQGHELRERQRWAHTARIVSALTSEVVSVNDLTGTPSWGASEAAVTKRSEYEDLKRDLEPIVRARTN